MTVFPVAIRPLHWNGRGCAIVHACSVLLCAYWIPDARAQEYKFKLVSHDSVSLVGGGLPQRMTLGPQPPPGIKRTPPALSAPFYGALRMGPRESPGTYFVILDEPDGRPSHLYLDTNGNGDLTDDPEPDWEVHFSKGRSGELLATASGAGYVRMMYGDENVEVRLLFNRFDKSDASQPAMQGVLMYYGDYSRNGDIRIGDQVYEAMLTDDLSSGDYRGRKGGSDSGVRLVIDINGDGKFDRRSFESFDIAKPFNVGGATYEVKGMNAAGSRFEIIKSSRTAQEVKTPLELKAGVKAPAFGARTINGQPLQFPADFGRRLVLLHFWTSGSVACQSELKSLKEAYTRFQSDGLELLGVNLDEPKSGARLSAFLSKNGIAWAQIYSGQAWKTEAAGLYSVISVPRAFLVDADTGLIVAGGTELRGNQIIKTLDERLERRRTK